MSSDHLLSPLSQEVLAQTEGARDIEAFEQTWRRIEDVSDHRLNVRLQCLCTFDRTRRAFSDVSRTVARAPRRAKWMAFVP